MAWGALAEVVPHGSNNALPGSASIGPGGLVPGGAITVPADLGELARNNGNANLFHSFSVFNVLGTAGESVTFAAPTDPGVSVNNVISRVTGGTSTLTGSQASFIDGSLSSAMPGANFFLINPNGVIFGPNAALSVSGSFYASTADAVHLQGDGVFYADPNEASTLTAAAPEAFGFLGENPAAIANQAGTFLTPANLNLPAGATFGLVGGDINLTFGSIGLPTGKVSLASAASQGRAVITDAGMDMSGLPSLGDVNMSNFFLVDGHEVYIRAGRFEMADAYISPGSLSLNDPPLGPPPNGGVIDVKVRGEFGITGTGPGFFGLRPGIYAFTQVAPFDPGPSVPSIRVEAGTLRMTGPAQIRSDRFNPGAVGEVVVDAKVIEIRDGANITSQNNSGFGVGADLTIRASERLTLEGNPSKPFTGIAANGREQPFRFFRADSGNIVIEAGQVEISNSAEINTDSFALGKAGDITILADTMSLSWGEADNPRGIASQSQIAGDAGTILIRTRKIDIRDGFQISATVRGAGDAGGVDVRASESITMSGVNSGIFSAAYTFTDEEFVARGLDPALWRQAIVPFFDDGNPGNGGSIFVDTPRLVMNGDTRIDSSTFGDGRGGNVTGTFGTVEVNDTAQIRALSGGTDRFTGEVLAGSGDGGRVSIEAGRVSLSGASEEKQAGISTTTIADGDAGRIDILADVVEVTDGATISSESTGEGLTADDIAQGKTPGVAGEIRIETTDRIVVHRAEITTDATRSDGGSIELIAVNLLDLLDSRITTSVGAAASGGSITVDPIFIILQRSEILANAEFGPGGRIQLTAEQLIIDQESSVSARSLFNPELDGEVVVNAPESDLIAGVTVLPGSFLDASTLLTGACRSAGSNSLALVGRGGVPVDPDGYLPSLSVAGIEPSADLARNTGEEQHHQVAMLASLACIR